MPHASVAKELCPIGKKVGIHNGRKPLIPGVVVGYAVHERPLKHHGKHHEMIVSCVVQLTHPFDSPEGLYVRYLVVHPGDLTVRRNHVH